ncbi:MAG TPA: RHS repeat-associated core domain-containing protein [Actinomadura sp.]|nr:RHS repeat-associated core domain-containing protein [Actinomadura sp.]
MARVRAGHGSGGAAKGIFKAAEPLLRKLLKSGGHHAGDAARRVRRRVGDGPGRSLGGRHPRKTAVPANSRRTCGDPIDIATGEMVLTQTDVELAGTLPLVLMRTHVSSYRGGRWFGASWASVLDQWLEVSPDRVRFAAADGMVLSYPHPFATVSVLPEEGPRWPLRLDGEGGHAITDPESGRTLHFAPVAGAYGQPLRAITDRNGNRIDLDYDAEGILTEVRHSGGYRIGVETTEGLITALRLRDADDAVLVRFGYEDGDLTEVINSSGLPLRFTYDTEGRIVRWEDRNGCWYGYRYDENGRCVATSGAGGSLSGTFTYDTASRVTVATNSLGQATRFELVELGQVVAETDPLGNTITSEWDRYDRLLTRTDPLGRVVRYGYDAAGDLIAITWPDGAQATIRYNDLHLPVELVEADGTVWRQDYDERGNLVAVTDPLGATTTYAYDQRGGLTAARDAAGNETRVATDAAGLPVAVTDPLGGTIRYTRDPFGRISTTTDAVGGVTRLGWTAEGKPAWRVLPDGATERWSYDAEGNLAEYVDAAGQVTRTEVTHFDLPSAETGPDGARLEFGYDTELRLVSVTNPQGLVWRYEYDPAGNLVREADFNGRVLAYTHDAARQLVERANGAGQVVRFTRDPLGNVVEKRSGDAVTTYAYDPVGRLARAVNGDADLRFERDAAGRVTAEICNGRVLASAYDILGRRVRRRTPSGAESVWEHDAAGQPVALHTAGQTMRFGYDPAGREIQRLIGPGVALAQRWDAAHRLRSQTVMAGSASSPRQVQHRAYEYRTDGYLVGIEDQLLGSRRFDLDPAGRVTAVHGAGWNERYAYDAAGNLTQAAWPSPQHPTPDSDAIGEREYAGTLIRRAGNVRYEHDAQGRLVRTVRRTLSGQVRQWTYTWDAQDRLVSATTPEGTWRYTYDPIGRRTSKRRVNDRGTVIDATWFSWDGTQLAEQVTTTPDGRAHATSWDWEAGGHRAVTQIRRSWALNASQARIDIAFYAIVTDLVGTPTELVTLDGRIAWHQTTSLWGTPISSSPAEVDCPLRFPGQYRDDETGLHYNLNRYYDPDTAAYVSADPLGLWPAPNPHRYVKNPLAWIDPLGLAACKVVHENDAGRFGDLDPGVPGDGLTPHHMPQAAAEFTSRRDGGAIVMTHADHTLTRTYGPKGRVTKAAEAGLPFRTVLSRDIQDLRRIGQVQHGDPSYFNPGITKLLAYYRSIGKL